ncbi:MAG: DUF1624 domain-containing protein [Ignavibacterium sp.]|nr:MAG: DUF1624 domain-containing protein [Ignavibacterium sp.]
MSSSENKHRIIFIDLIRAFAVFQMVQGHTVDALLSDSYRNEDNIIYAVWYFMRGMTAPIFMFTAGTVFTYLFRLVKEPFNKNVRVVKGIKRGLLLIFIGYLLRYPTWKLVDFSDVSEYSWNVFFAVDVLHLIGFSLFILLFLFYLSEKLKLNDYILLSLSALVIFIISPLFFNIDWEAFLPQFLAGYFYEGSGSLFPIFPWAGYVVAGGVLGSYLARNPMVFKSIRFSINLAVIGAAFIVASFALEFILEIIGETADINAASTSLILFRLGFVLILNAIVSFISIEANSIPKFIILIGRNTLLIYVVHLLIVYGSAWNPGLYTYFARSFTGWETLLFTVLVLGLMTLMVLLENKFNIKNKQLVT